MLLEKGVERLFLRVYKKNSLENESKMYLMQGLVMESHSDEIAFFLSLLILVQFWSSLCYALTLKNVELHDRVRQNRKTSILGIV